MIYAHKPGILTVIFRGLFLLRLFLSFRNVSGVVMKTQSAREQMLTAFQKASNGFDMRGIVESVSNLAASNLDGPLLTYKAAFWVGVGFGEALKQSMNNQLDACLSVGIGRDSRESGIELTKWLAGGLEAVGVTAYDVGLCTTPAMYLSCITDRESCITGSQKSQPFSGAISVTASHLPSQWNGFKFFTPDKPSNIGEEGIEMIVNCCALEKFETLVPTASDFDGRLPMSFLPIYSEFLKKTVRDLVKRSDLIEQSEGQKGCAEDYFQQYPLTGLKVCVNAGNGAGGFLAATLRELGADTSSSLHLDPDGTFPNHIANPEDKKAIQCTADAVTIGNADIGICLDTDADRVGLVEYSGDVNKPAKLLNRNNLIALVSKVALRGNLTPGNPGVIVTDSATSNGLSQFIEMLGGRHVRYKKGYRYVIEMGRSIEECVAAVECSGHGAWRDNGWVDDGCYTAVKLLAELSLMRLEQRIKNSQNNVASEIAPQKNVLCQLSDLLVGLTEPEESVELRFRVTGGPAQMNDVTVRALNVLRAIAEHSQNPEKYSRDNSQNSDTRNHSENFSGNMENSECATVGKEMTSSYKWEVEKVNYEGLRVNFDFIVYDSDAKNSDGGSALKYTGWCMLRASLHEPILSMQLESDQIGGAQRAAKILLFGNKNDVKRSTGLNQLESVMDIASLRNLAFSSQKSSNNSTKN